MVPSAPASSPARASGRSASAPKISVMMTAVGSLSTRRAASPLPGPAQSRRTGKRSDTPAATATGRTVAALLDAYFASDDFADLGERTKNDYRKKANAVRWRRQTKEERRAKAPLVPETMALAPAHAVDPAAVKAFFETLRRERGLSMARGVIMVLSAAYAWARLAPAWRIAVNPCHRLKLATPDARLVIWTDQEIRAVVAAADRLGHFSIGDAVMLGLFCGQREGDILALVDQDGRSVAEAAKADEAIRFFQSKTGARVAVFAAPQLVTRLVQAEARRAALIERRTKVRGGNVVALAEAPVVMRETTAAAWDQGPFIKTFAAVRAEAAKSYPSILARPTGPLFFLDLRDTAVTWLARAGCTLAQIASITGHSLQSVTTIMKHYLELGEPLAREARDKLVAWMDREGVQV